MGSAAMHGSNLGDQIDRLATSRALQIPGSRAAKLRGVVHRMLARAPADRFQSAESVLVALGHPIHEELDVTTQAVRPRERSDSVRYAWVAGVLLVAAMSVGIVAMMNRGTTVEEPPLRREMPAGLSEVRPVAAVTPPVELDVGPDVSAPDDAGSQSRGCEVALIRRPGKAYRLENGRQRVVAVPRGYEEGLPHPVILLFHDRFASAKSFLDHGDFRTLADRHGIVVISLRDRDLTPWKDVVPDDAASNALARVGKELCLDHSRVYAIGDGVGASLVDRLRCTDFPLAGIASANHRSSLNACTRGARVPHIHFAARHNDYLPIGGGASCLGTVAPLTAQELSWIEEYECQPKEREWRKGKRVECREWACDQAALVTCEVDAGYGWPQRKEPRQFDVLTGCDGDPPNGIPMAEIAWEFFTSRHD